MEKKESTDREPDAKPSGADRQTRGKQPLSDKSMADQYRELDQAEKAKTPGEDAMTWDDFDLTEAAEMVPEGNVVPEDHGDSDLETSDEDTGTNQLFSLFDKDYEPASNQIRLCSNVLDLAQVHKFIQAHKKSLLIVKISWKGLRDIFAAKLEEMEKFDQQFEMYKRSCLLYTSPSPRDRG